MTDYLAFRKLRRSISTMAALAVVAAFAGYGTHNAAAVEMSPAAKAVVDYDKSGKSRRRNIASPISPNASTIPIAWRGWRG